MKVGIGFRRQSDARQQLHRLRPRVFLLAALHLHRAFGDVFERSLVRKQVEALKHHAGLQALACDLPIGEAVQSPALFADAQRRAGTDVV